MMVEAGLLAAHLVRFVALVVVVVAARSLVAIVADLDHVELGAVDLGIDHLRHDLHDGNSGSCLRVVELVVAEHHSVLVPVVELGCWRVVEEWYRGYHRHTASSR